MKQLIDEIIYCPHKLLPENIFIELPNVITLEKIIEVKFINTTEFSLYYRTKKAFYFFI